MSAKEMSGSRGKVRLKVLKDSKIEDNFLNMICLDSFLLVSNETC